MSALWEADLRLSVEEYIQGELISEKRHEYVGGQVYAMAGASEVHNTIAGNLFAARCMRISRATPAWLMSAI